MENENNAVMRPFLKSNSTHFILNKINLSPKGGAGLGSSLTNLYCNTLKHHITIMIGTYQKN